jgi:hypothetical protein
LEPLTKALQKAPKRIPALASAYGLKRERNAKSAAPYPRNYRAGVRALYLQLFALMGIKKHFQDIFPVAYWPEAEFYILYEFSDISLELSKKSNNKQINLQFNKRYNSIKDKLYEKAEELQKRNRDLSFLHEFLYKGELEKTFYEIFDSKEVIRYPFQQIFIPDGRTFISSLSKVIFTISLKNIKLDPFVLNFGQLYQEISQEAIWDGMATPDYISQQLFDYKNKIFSNLRSINKGSIEYDFNTQELFITQEPNRKIDLKDASSGQKEVTPLMLSLLHFANLMKSYLSGALYIEEPEAHLFPEAQKKVVESIALTYNFAPQLSNLFITTHSAYVLSTFNNLLYAGKINRQELSGEVRKQLHSLIPKSFMLHGEDFSIHYLDGEQAHNLWDDEFGVIDQNKLDEVSEDLGATFGQLMDLDPTLVDDEDADSA